MTTGEYLVSLSGLSSGTALEHLLAIQARIGGGATILTSRMSLVVGLDEISVDQRPVSIQVFPEDQKAIHPLLCDTNITLTQKATATYVERKADEIVVSRRPSHPKIIRK